jgi:hypothetical protein
MHALTICVLLLAAFSRLIVAQSSSSSTVSGTTITYEIIGDANVTTNLTVWDEYPVTLTDTVYSVMASLLNGVLPGTTPARRDTSSPGTTSTAPKQEDEPMKWYWILLIALGGAIGVTAIVLAIYFGIEASKAKATHAEIPLLPPNDYSTRPPPPPPEAEGIRPAGGGAVSSSLGFRYSSSGGGGYSKIIQLPIVCPKPRDGAYPPPPSPGSQ